MMNVDEILARLQNGETMDDIAADISKALTTAEQKFQEEKEKKAAEVAALETEVKLNDLAETILLAVDEYLRIKSPEFAEAFAEEDISVEDFREMLDDLIESVAGIFTLSSKLKSLEEKSKPSTAIFTPKTADDKIADFLKAMGL